MLFHVVKRRGPSGGAVHSSLLCVQLVATNSNSFWLVWQLFDPMSLYQAWRVEALPSNYSCGASQITGGSEPLV